MSHQDLIENTVQVGDWLQVNRAFGKINNNFDTLFDGLDKSNGGYEFTGGFTDRTTGLAGQSDVGSNVQYTQDMVDDQAWLRFGLDGTSQATNDAPYWTTPTPEVATGIGLFGGSYMPQGVTSMFDYSFNDSTYSDAVTSGNLQYTAATG